MRIEIIAGLVASFALMGCSSMGGAGSPVASVGSSVATSAVLSELEQRATRVVDAATDSGSFLIASAGIEVVNAIDEAEIAANRVADTQIAKIDSKLRDQIGALDVLVSDLEKSLADRAYDATDIALRGEQMVADLRIWDGVPYITEYTPKVIAPSGTAIIPLEITLINGRSANPRLFLPDGSEVAARTQLTAMRWAFEVPRAGLGRNSDTLALSKLKVKLEGNALMPLLPRRALEREIGVLVLGGELATFRLVPTVTRQVRQTQPRELDLGTFKGRNREINRAVTPSTGWRVDTQSPITYESRNGNAGRCEGVRQYTLSDGGFTFFARVDERRDGINSFQDGRVSCIVRFTEYKYEASVSETRARSGTVGWLADKTVALPDGTTSWILTLRMFDGRERSFIAPGSDEFFAVNSNGRHLVITPAPPRNLAQAFRR